VRRFHSHSSAAPTGILEGHLKILSLKEVELQDDAKAITEAPEQPYSEYPLIIRSRDGGKEVARLTADAGGNYRLVLPPGEYHPGRSRACTETRSDEPQTVHHNLKSDGQG